MDGAKSELIVPSGHPAHQNPRAIEEVRRILTLNASSSDRSTAAPQQNLPEKKKAAARGSDKRNTPSS